MNKHGDGYVVVAIHANGTFDCVMNGLYPTLKAARGAIKIYEAEDKRKGYIYSYTISYFGVNIPKAEIDEQS